MLSTAILKSELKCEISRAAVSYCTVMLSLSVYYKLGHNSHTQGDVGCERRWQLAPAVKFSACLPGMYLSFLHSFP